MCFYLAEKDAKGQLGPKAYQKVLDLGFWLYGNKPDMKFRSSPSLITRSEAELFGISSPRFALRTYFTRDSFVNARRLVNFVHNAAIACKTIPGNLNLPHDIVWESITNEELLDEIVTNGQCIADSLLKMPDKTTKNRKYNSYEAIECDLGLAYGEGKQFSATPYLQHTTIGGGMCAQAACFMVLALYANTAKAILGIAEITAIVQGDKNHLDLSGMSEQSIVEFFRKKDIMLNANSEIEYGDTKRHSALAIHSYLKSKIPLILPVDLGKLCGFNAPNGSLLKKNGNDVELHMSNPNEKRRHIVVLVGCHKTDQTQYLLNDPATYPFIKATLDDIYDIRPYPDSDSEAIPDNKTSDTFSYVSVTPPQVQFPLLNFIEDFENQRINHGLISRAIIACRNLTDKGVPPYKLPPSNLGQFRLINFRDDRDAIETRLKSFSPAMPVLTIDLLIHRFAEHVQEKTWKWIQYISYDSKNKSPGWILSWDAQQKPMADKPSEYSSYLDNLFKINPSADEYLRPIEFPRTAPLGAYDAAPLQHQTPEDIEEADIPDVVLNEEEKFGAALLTSFSTTGAINEDKGQFHPYNPANYATFLAGENFSISKIPAEVYLFMETELPHCRKLLNKDVNDNCNAVEFLANLNDDDTLRIAEVLSKRFLLERNPIVGLASFVSEITGDKGSGQAKLAIDAIKNLVNIACKLQDGLHPTCRVELVAGSAIHGLCKGIPKADNARAEADGKYYAIVLDRDKVWDRVLNNLQDAVNHSIYNPKKHKVFLSMELEPGPCFQLRNWRSIETIPHKIETHFDELRKHIGYNLDMGHWRIAEVNAKQVLGNRKVLKRIYHSHINCHHTRAHFGDAPLSKLMAGGNGLNKPSDFDRWIRLLKHSIIAQRNEKSQSKHISLELEAAKNMDLVMESYVELIKLLL